MREVPVLFAFTEADRWRPGIGDPTVIGWLTVVAYGVAMLLCLRAARDAGAARRGRQETIFWWILTAMMLLLGVNKQLDLQTWFTLTGKKLALSEGWYNDRRVVQLAFILFIAAAGVALFFFVSRFVRTRRAELRLPLLGLSFIICFVVIRAASFHHIDQFLKFDIGGVRMNWVLELGGILIVAAGAARVCAKPGKENRSRGLLTTARSR